MHNLYFFPNYQTNISKSFSKYLDISSCHLQTQDSTIMLYAATYRLLPYYAEISSSWILKASLKKHKLQPTGYIYFHILVLFRWEAPSAFKKF